MNQLNRTGNLLPRDGFAVLFSHVYPEAECNRILNTLSNEILWQNDRVKLYGKIIITRRKTAWYGDPGAEYTYSGISRSPVPWTPLLTELRNHVESVVNASFNSCLLNYYHDGNDSMSWHSDNEPMLGKNPSIASLSFGAERRFLFRHRSGNETIETILGNGSLLHMYGDIQHHWKHALPKSAKVKTPRINLTFRQIV